MITAKVSNSLFHEVDAQAYIVIQEQGCDLPSDCSEGCSKLYPHYESVLKQSDFTGASGQVCSMTGERNGESIYLIFIGLGSLECSKEDKMERYRRAVGTTIRQLEKLKIKRFVRIFPDHERYEVEPYVMSKEMVSTSYIASYHFNQFITDEKRHMNDEYEVTICAPSSLHDAIITGVEMGTRIGHAVNQARHWCDLPPQVLTPEHLAEQAHHVAEPHDNLTCRIFTQKECIEMGMGGLEAVSRGSNQEARCVVMEYKTDDPDAQTVGLVGKGVTFDSGGLSIKPAGAMEDMKDDMAGAASVIATMQALAYLKPKVNVVAVTPITENLTGGSAFKPGDIISHYNGVTSEVRNTDAEGRLILADALAYIIERYNVDALINTATLTGACAYALGPFYAGLMSKHDEFAGKMIEASKRSGDRVWPLPFHDDYKVAVKSKVADVCNIGCRQVRAGTITAGFFLSHFVDDRPWIHLDVAGTSFNVPHRSYYRPGGTGFGVRLFVDLLMNW